MIGYLYLILVATGALAFLWTIASVASSGHTFAMDPFDTEGLEQLEARVNRWDYKPGQEEHVTRRASSLKRQEVKFLRLAVLASLSLVTVAIGLFGLEFDILVIASGLIAVMAFQVILSAATQFAEESSRLNEIIALVNRRRTFSKA
jgi:hypothetical protein